MLFTKMFSSLPSIFPQYFGWWNSDNVIPFLGVALDLHCFEVLNVCLIILRTLGIIGLKPIIKTFLVSVFIFDF